MKKILFVFSVALSTYSIGQTVDAESLNPKQTSNPDYKFIKFETPNDYIGGLMWNIGSPSFGNGDDFTIFSNLGRDINIRTGTGNFIVFPSSGGNMGIGTTTPSEKLSVEKDGNTFIKLVNTSSNGSTMRIGPVSSNGYQETQLQFENRFGLFDSSTGQWRLSIKENGNIGIGTGNPISKLHILSPMIAESSNSQHDANLLIQASGSRDLQNGVVLGFSLPASTNGDNMWQHGRIMVLPDNPSSSRADGKMYLQTRSYFNGAWNWRNNLSLKSNGNVGIGTLDPKVKLEIYDFAYSSQLRIHTNQHAGVAKLEIAGGSAFLDSNPDNYSGWSIYHSYVNTKKDLYFRHGESGDPSFVLKDHGSVGIGTLTTGTHKLAVEGTIGAREIKVETAVWPDFVFENTYDLPSLEEVEKYIVKNNHLPEIPSEAEVLQEGIKLGEMNAKLLQKIEELTLYLIEQNKELKAQNDRIISLEEKLLEK